MLVDRAISFHSRDMGAFAKQSEKLGYDAIWSTEVGHDPFLILAAAAGTTTTLELGTAVTIAFGRSPLITATMANDLQILSRGRLILGLGSQIKPHIEKRYSMPWSQPAARMREYVLALRAIWASWHEGTKLNFRGEFYRHTLMTPFFSPGANEYGPPKVYLAAVGELMTNVTAEVADGLLVHPFTTKRYLGEITLPTLHRGLEKAGRSRGDIQIAYSGLVASGETEEELEVAREAVRGQIAFYGSTPAYRGVLELHGWGDLQSDLNTLTRRAQWKEMSALIDDEILDTFAVVARSDVIGAAIRERFEGLIDRFSFYAPEQYDRPYWHDVARELKSA